MEWTPQQDAALKAVDQWLNESDQQLFRLFGYAGTGKTTLAKHLAEGVRGPVHFCAYTGKAAHVLRMKGCDGASTIHSLIYYSGEASKRKLKELEQALVDLRASLQPGQIHPEEAVLIEAIKLERKNATRPVFTLNEESVVRDAALVVVDECSMVDGQMGEDLLKFGVKVLVLGDPAQLPPVKGNGGFFTDAKPDFMLTDVQRQARDNPIIALATSVREGVRPAPGEWGGSRVLAARSRLDSGEVVSAGQVLVGKNATRRSYNQRIRQLLGRTQSLPETDDKLVCLRNDHDLGLLNGGLWRVKSCLGDSDECMLSLASMDLLDVQVDCNAHSAPFLGEEVPWFQRKDAQEFDYGYAMTVHKSQGSQWEDVIIFDESSVFRQDWNRWLYTAITRAAERVTIALT